MRGDIEIVKYLADAAGSCNLVIDVGITHDRIGSHTAEPQLNGTLAYPNTHDAPLNEAAGICMDTVALRAFFFLVLLEERMHFAVHVRQLVMIFHQRVNMNW